MPTINNLFDVTVIGEGLQAFFSDEKSEIKREVAPEVQRVYDIRNKVEQIMGDLIKIESSGKHTTEKGSLVTSPVGAKGITQVLPSTAKTPGYGIKPLQNETMEEYIRFGKEYLTKMIDVFDNEEQGIAAYNAGPGAVHRAISKANRTGRDWKEFLPKETKEYIKKVKYTEPTEPALHKPQTEDVMGVRGELDTTTSILDTAIGRFKRGEALLTGIPIEESLKQQMANPNALDFIPGGGLVGGIKQVSSGYLHMPTSVLKTIRDVNRNITPKSKEELVNITNSIQREGIKNPIVVTVSTKDNRAYITDGNTRVTVADNLNLSSVPVKLEKTTVPFTKEQLQKSRPIEELGISLKDIPEKQLTKEMIEDRKELIKLLNTNFITK